MDNAVIIKQVGAGGSIFKAIFKHWYVLIILILTLPPLINSISVARETRNYIYPFLVVGMSLVNSDSVIYQNIGNLKESPEKAYGMAKPETGIWKGFVYKWKVFLFWFSILGEIFLISLPFMTIYKLTKLFKSSAPAGNVIISIIFGLIFLIFVNLLILVHAMINNASPLIQIPVNPDFYQESWFIIKSVLPFHGIGSLISYIFTSI